MFFCKQLEETLLAYIEDEMAEIFLDIIHPTNKYVLFFISLCATPFFLSFTLGAPKTANLKKSFVIFPPNPSQTLKDKLSINDNLLKFICFHYTKIQFRVLSVKSEKMCSQSQSQGLQIKKSSELSASYAAVARILKQGYIYFSHANII